MSQYDENYDGWISEQIALLREAHFTQLDRENLIYLLERARGEQYAHIGAHLEQLLILLLRHRYQPQHQESDKIAVIACRTHLTNLLAVHPELVAYGESILADRYEKARVAMDFLTGYTLLAFPKTCEWSFEEVIDRDFFPSPLKETESLYGKDTYLWWQDQVHLFLKGEYDKLDKEHLAGELIWARNYEVNKVEKHLFSVLRGMLEWEYSEVVRYTPTHYPEAWLWSFITLRSVVEYSPSLLSHLKEILPTKYAKAKKFLLTGPRPTRDTFPDTCPWTIEDIIEKSYRLVKPFAEPVQLYDTDFHRWTQEQVYYLRNGLYEELDTGLLIKEITELGDYRDAIDRSTCAILEQSLLTQWSAASVEEDDDDRQWLISTFTHSPSLKAYYRYTFPDQYRRACVKVAEGTGLLLATFPEVCPWTPEQVLGEA